MTAAFNPLESWTPSASSQVAFNADLEKFNAAFERAGAVLTYEDGSKGVDPTNVPQWLLDAHSALLSYGYANGLL
jgi:hypothetical protein